MPISLVQVLPLFGTQDWCEQIVLTKPCWQESSDPSQKMKTFSKAASSTKISSIRLDYGKLQLFGRDREQGILQEVYQKSKGDKHETPVMLVYGYSGAGKTSLVKQALQDLVESESSFLCTGKFEQYRLSQAPWHGIIDACEDLCPQILTCDNRRTEIRELLMTEYDGSEVKLLTDLIPSLPYLMKEDKGGETNGEEGVGSVKAVPVHVQYECIQSKFHSLSYRYIPNFSH